MTTTRRHDETMSYEIIAAEKRPYPFDGVDPEHSASRTRTTETETETETPYLDENVRWNIFELSDCTTREQTCAADATTRHFCNTKKHVAECRVPRRIIEHFRATAKEEERPDVNAMRALAELENVADEHFEALFDIASKLPLYPLQEFTKKLGAFGDKLPETLFQKQVVEPALSKWIDEGDRAAAIEALGSFGKRGSEYARELKEALYSDEEKVQNAAVQALRNMSRHVDEKFKEELLKANKAARSKFNKTNNQDDYAIMSAFEEVLAPLNPDE